MSKTNNSVVIKGNKNGIIVVIDKKLSFDEIKECIGEKFKASAKVFGTAKMAIAFEGKELSLEQEREILDIIAEETDLNIVCVMDNNELRQEKMKAATEAKLDEIATSTGQFYKGTLRSGQVLESETSLIILGDVNPGAKVVAKGNVIVLGALKGNVFAGVSGNEKTFVVAIEMAPMQIRIGDFIARSQDGNGTPKKIGEGPQIAFVEEGNIYIERLDKATISDIKM